MSSVNPTVFIVEDDVVIAEAMGWLFKTVGLNVEHFPNGKAYLNAHDPNRQGCLIIDVRMPEMSGLELQEKLIQKKSRLPILFITGHGDIQLAVRAMRAGALNFITKPFNDQALLDEVQRAIALNIKQTVETNIAEHFENYQKLSSREKIIMKSVVDGKLNKEVAHELDIAVSTVELHRSNVMQKMKASSLAQLIKIYLLLENANLLNETSTA